ncbi:MAG TPA: PP2C family protein-serine/threonine phosphatase [Nocardioidaceae bacterium]|nr:PP2C family protein-serine/threonine phosphatase [Nocardioidaceae bacterium]
MPAAQLSRRWGRRWRRIRYSESSLVVALGLISTLIGFGVVAVESVPVSALVIPMVLGNQVLSPRTLPWLVVYSLAVLVVGLSIPDTVFDGRRVFGIIVTFIVGLIILVSSFRRTRLGVAGARGESMLVDLRERIARQSQMPMLPRDWYAEAVMRSAGGSSFAGDFIVASASADRRNLEVAVVDVSGKGEQAGTRSLLLSGAFGGLLGALPPEQFLPAANDYLLRQDWSEGFATAVHLSLDLQTGKFELRSAGHPPAVQLLAGSGRWAIHESEGPVLGLMGQAHFNVMTGTLNYGDALLMYTDGLVETPERDISLGIDRLLGQGERMLRSGFEHGARRLIDELESMSDDRALFLLHRR